MIELRIAKPTPSLNVTLRQHWTTRHKMRNEWYMLIAEARGAARRWDIPKWQRVRLTIVRVSHRPIMDRDNLVGGTKALTDALVEHGYMTDDTDEVVVERVVEQEKIPRTQPGYTMVRIEPLA